MIRSAAEGTRQDDRTHNGFIEAGPACGPSSRWSFAPMPRRDLHLLHSTLPNKKSQQVYNAPVIFRAGSCYKQSYISAYTESTRPIIGA